MTEHADKQTIPATQPAGAPSEAQTKLPRLTAANSGVNLPPILPPDWPEASGSLPPRFKKRDRVLVLAAGDLERREGIILDVPHNELTGAYAVITDDGFLVHVYFNAIWRAQR